MVSIETYDKVQELKQKGMKVKNILQELNLVKKQYLRYCLISREQFLKYYNDYKAKDIENYRDFILSILSITPNCYNTTIYYRALEEFPDFYINRNRFFRFIDKVRRESGYLRKIRIRERQIADIPGYEAQVDFGQYLIKDMYGKDIRLYFFCMVLSYSRMMFAYFQRNPFTTSAAIEAHEYAFKFFGGRPQSIRYDQDKIFVVSENFRDVTLVKEFEEYARKVGFTIDVCHKYDPNTKGKIENVVKNIKRKFLDGRIFTGIDSFNSIFIEWLDNIGNNDINYTTKKTPKEMFKEEYDHLQKVKTFVLDKPIILTLDENSIFEYSGNTYQVPKDLLLHKCRVKIKVNDNKINVYREFDDEPIATFNKADGLGKIITEKSGGTLQQIIDNMNKLFGGDKYYEIFMRESEKDSNIVRIAQLRRIIRLARYFDKSLILKAFEFCNKTKRYRVFEVIAFLLAQPLNYDIKIKLGNKEYKTYRNRAKEIKEILNYE